jgi:hypothetical protein
MTLVDILFLNLDMISMFFVTPNKVNKEFSISKLYLLNKIEHILDFEWL